MISRKSATAAGKVLNDVAERLRIESMEGQTPTGYAMTVTNAVRTANEVMFQYYLIPRAIREEYFRKELMADGVPLQNMAEE